MEIRKIHAFDSRTFRRLRLPVLLMGLMPSFVLDGFILYAFAIGKPVLTPLIQAADLQATLAALAGTFILLQLGPIMVYLRVRGQRARSVVRETENMVVYRKCRLMGLLKTDWKNGYAYNDDYELVNAINVRRTAAGGIAAKGHFKVVCRLPQTEAFNGEKTVRRIVIPGYFKDLDSIAEKLSRNRR